MLNNVEDRRHADHAPLVLFAPAIILTKDEVFEACAGLAVAERLLSFDGHVAEASWAATLLEQLEDRLAARCPDDQGSSSAFSGSKSSDRELTQ
jgi:hypothetical protein